MCLYEIKERHEEGSDFYNEIRTGYGAFRYDLQTGVLTTDTMGKNIKLDTWMLCANRVEHQTVYWDEGGRNLPQAQRKYKAGFHKFASRKAAIDYADNDGKIVRYCPMGGTVHVVLPVSLWGVRTVETQHTHYERNISRDVHKKCFVADQMLVESEPLIKILSKWWKDEGDDKGCWMPKILRDEQ